MVFGVLVVVVVFMVVAVVLILLNNTTKTTPTDTTTITTITTWFPQSSLFKKGEASVSTGRCISGLVNAFARFLQVWGHKQV